MSRSPNSGGPASRDFLLPEGEPGLTLDIQDTLVIREGATMLLSDSAGNIPADNHQGLGLYHRDTRHLSEYDLYFHTAGPIVLRSTAQEGYTSEHVVTNPPLRMPDGQELPANVIELRRRRVAGAGLEETIEITSHSQEPTAFDLYIQMAADFADMFEVRGYAREIAGQADAPACGVNHVLFRYTGIDGVTRATRIRFSKAPDKLTAGRAIYRVVLKHRQRWSTRIRIDFPASAGRRKATTRDAIASSYDEWLSGATRISTDNAFFNQVLERALCDLRMLWSHNAHGASYTAAGVPWFDALFGRDSIIIGLQTLAFRPEIARHTLEAVAAWQGRKLEPSRDEEPGKILHEYRFGEIAQAGELPFAPYYGTVDATPLFLMLVAEYYRWTADTDLIVRLKDNILAALNWLRDYGDPENSGFISYKKRSARGIVNQGWKDSFDSVIRSDGSLCDAPISLAEVQGYAYAAKLRIGPVLRVLGLDTFATELEGQCQDLRKRFDRVFWSQEEGNYAMAIDGHDWQCAAASSNAGHALWCGIAPRGRARSATQRLLARDMFNGWGIRTMSEDNPRYNPLGYHLGTVWPHDSAIAAFGFRMYGFNQAFLQIMTGMFEASLSFPHFRLPELFGGQGRDEYRTPVPYPVACRPQGWAAGAIPMLVHAMLGLVPDSATSTLTVVRPRLPEWLGMVEVRGLRVGQGSADLNVRRTGRGARVEVVKNKKVRVVQAARWPLDA